MSKAPREQFSAYGSSNYPGSKFSFRRTNSTAGLVESKAFRKRFSAYGSSNYPGSSFRRTAGVQSIPEEVFGVREFKLSWNSFRHTDRHLWSPKYSEVVFGVRKPSWKYLRRTDRVQSLPRVVFGLRVSRVDQNFRACGATVTSQNP